MPSGASDPRIEKLYRSDRIWAIIAVLVLWLTILFVFAEIVGAASSGIAVALAISGGLVLLFNTASITALLSHYRQDKVHLYSLDLHYLDEMKASKR